MQCLFTPGNWIYVYTCVTLTQNLLSVQDNHLCCKMHFLFFVTDLKNEFLF